MVLKFTDTVIYNFYVRRGDTSENIMFTLVDPAFPDGLTGASIKMVLYDPASNTIAKTFSTGDGILINDAAAGVFSLLPYKPLIPAKGYSYEIEITYPGDIVKTRFAGTYIIKNDLIKNV